MNAALVATRRSATAGAVALGASALLVVLFALSYRGDWTRSEFARLAALPVLGAVAGAALGAIYAAIARGAVVASGERSLKWTRVVIVVSCVTFSVIAIAVLSAWVSTWLLVPGAAFMCIVQIASVQSAADTAELD